jgi:hypothetical protein
MYPDNDERAIFAKGVVEIKIKLGSWYYTCSWLDGGNVANIHEAFL